MYKSIIVLAEAMKDRIPEALNVTGHLGQAISAQAVNAGIAEYVNYRDVGGAVYPSISRWPVIVLTGRRSKMWTLWDEAGSVGIIRSAFFESMFDGGTELQLERTAQLDRNGLGLVGVAAFGEAEGLNALGRRFSLWR